MTGVQTCALPISLSVQARHISYILQEAREREAKEVDITEEAEAAWVQTVIDASLQNIGFLESCTPGYYNNEGQPNGPMMRRNGTYAPGIMKFSAKLEEWRAEGNLQGVQFIH